MLNPHTSIISRLRDCLGAGDLWKTHYEPMLNNFAELVQGLPASEAHHHDTVGGLLEHSLEVALGAIERAEHKICVEGNQIELTQYMIVTLSLLHDIAKILVDQIIDLYGGDRRLGRWHPALGPMRLIAGATGYTLRFSSDRKYKTHSFSSAVFVHLIVPPAGHAWLFRDRQNYSIWLALLAGYDSYSDEITGVLREADGASAEAFRPDSSKRVVSTQRLSDHCLDTFKALAVDGGVRANAPGAMVFITRDVVWFVSNSTLNRIRSDLASKGVTLPRNNIQVMDDLQHDNLLQTTQSNKAIHHCLVKDGKWQTELTMLGISYRKLFGEEEKELFRGSISVIDDAAAVSGEVSKTEITAQKPPPWDENEKVEPESEETVSFWNWACSGISDSSLALNVVGAKFHIIEVSGQAALFIVSPNAFKLYDDSRWKGAQREFVRSNIVRSEPEGNLYCCKIIATGTSLTGYLVDDLSPINERLQKVNDQLVFKGVKKKGGEGANGDKGKGQD